MVNNNNFQQPGSSFRAVVLKIMKQTLFIVFILFYTIHVVNGQSTSHRQDSTKNAFSSTSASMLQFGLRYKSDSYYMGRADSAKAPYLTPSVSYYHKSGFFASGYLSYLTAKEQNRIDLITLAAGYDYFGEKILAGISVSQYFYSDLSYSIQSEMKTYLSAYMGYDFKWFMVVADASLSTSSNLDVFLGGEINRSFYLLNDRLRITPSIYTNWGTQHYYNEFYTKRSITTGGAVLSGGGSGSGSGGSGSGGSGSGGKPGGTNNTGGITPTTTTTITEVTTLESEKFQLMDYEFALQSSYRIKQFRILASGTILVPVNPSTIVTDQSTYVEDLSTGFLWSIGVRYTLK